jgi:hypothetical protein
MTNGNNTYATITPPNRTRSKSASTNTSKGLVTGKETDAAVKVKQKLKLDSRLEPIRDRIESQPQAIQDTLGDTAVAMLLATRKLRERRAGLVNMTRNVTSYPRSCNLKAKLAFPQDMKEDPQTQENVKVWDDYIQKTKDEMKKQVLKQGERTVEFLTEKRLDLFQTRVLTIAEGYFTWFAELEGLNEPPTLSNQAYGAVSIYCYFNSIGPGDRIFSYLFEEQDSLLKAFKLKYLTTASGTPLFSVAQLQDLTMILPNDFAPGSPLRLDADDPQNPREDDDERTITQGSQGAAAAPAIVAPPTPLPRDLGNVIYKVKDRLYDLIPILFVGLAESVETTQREQIANAKLEASLKTNKALDMAKIIDADMASQSIVAPENMTHLVNSLVDKRIETKGLQARKQLTKDAVKEARKKSLGGARVAKTPPSKQGNGGKRKGILRNVSFGSTPQPAKRAKKQNTRNPEADYEQLQQQRKTHNPYRTSSPSGRGFSPGRGRGHGRGRGASNRGRGRGRGRF